MAYVLAHNIISPLGKTSEENYLAVKAGKSGIHAYAPHTLGIPEGFTASLLSSDFEELALESAQKALAASGVDCRQDRVVFILSSTKGAIEKLSGQEDDFGKYGLSESAKRIASKLGVTTKPIVVCNACISGLSALILGARLIEMGRYDHAIVCGCDIPGRFIISGFQSLKALSSEPCRPFDMERFGLNLGAAAATIVLGKEKSHGEAWQIGNGFVKNDAFHISAPSKKADGLYAALKETLCLTDDNSEDGREDVRMIDDLAFVNAHGTATLFNDQMESIAIQRAGLSTVPANALKGYFGHTLGAAGVLETVLCMKAVDDHTVLGTKGFEELGVSGKMNVSAENRPTNKHSFVKMLSGFGGCNATLLASKECLETSSVFERLQNHKIQKDKGISWEKIHSVRIIPEGAWLDDEPLKVTLDKSLLTSLYKQYVGDYPKYYKMDGLSRLGFIASELLLLNEKACQDTNRAIILFNHSSSIASDRKYLASIKDKDNYFPSPSVFVYTLPNIVTGEIAIRHGYHGETSFYILEDKDEAQMKEILYTAFEDEQTRSTITGWIDYRDDAHFEAELSLVRRV